MDNINRFILEPTPEDILLLLAAKCHLGTTKVSSKMKQYIYSRRADGIFIIDIDKMWQKLMLAARVLATIKESTDIYVTSTSARGRRPASKLSMFLNTQVDIGRFSPGTFTKSIMEPQILISLDPYDDLQAIKESSQCCIPVISFVNSDSSLKCVDIGIPCNNVGPQSIGVMCYLLARAVLRLTGKLDYDTLWKVMPDMFFHTDEVVQTEETEGNADVTFDQKGGYDEGSWPAGGEGGMDFQFPKDDGVNWQNDNPKSDWMISSPTPDEGFNDTPSTEPIDWAEDVSSDNQKWQESNKSPWDE